MPMSAEGQREPLLHAHADAAGRGGGGSFSWLPGQQGFGLLTFNSSLAVLRSVLGFGHLTFNSAMAVCRSNGDRGAVARNVFSYVDLVLLRSCGLRWFERPEPGSATRSGRLKMAVWLLITALTIAFSYKMAAIMPITVLPVVWAMAGATVLGDLSALFPHRKPKDQPRFGAAGGSRGGGGSFSWLPVPGFGAVAFVVFPYVWLLTMAAIMPITVQLVAWALAGSMVLGGFSLFVHRKPKGLLAVLGGVASPVIRLIADTAASMHAVGDCRILCDLELYPVPKWVTLPNDTLLRILGMGRVELEHFSIPNVYLVEGFHKCLISMSQLDRDHGMYSCFGRGVGRIMLTDGTQVGGAILDENDGMYVLRYLEVPSRPGQDDE